MHSSSKESDVQFQLYFLDCQPDSIIRSLNDPSIVEHLYRAATNPILRFEKSYQRKESQRVTDIDHLSSSISPVLSITRTIPIELVTKEERKLSIPVETPPSAIEIKTEINPVIPPAPPLPPSLDLAIQLQKQSMKTARLSPDQASLWAKVENQNVADYFNQLTNTIHPKQSINTNESISTTILNERRTYNLGS